MFSHIQDLKNSNMVGDTLWKGQKLFKFTLPEHLVCFDDFS
jgi:hypothetical protein